ncbi:MAG: hypothetical protein ACYCO3_05330 [Mycobacteriales bacterium]
MSSYRTWGDPMRLLSDGVPLSLLADLVAEAKPESARILRLEGGDLSWITRAEHDPELAAH